MKKLILIMIAIISFQLQASPVRVRDLLDKDFTAHSISLWKIKGQYKIRIFSMARFDGNGNAIGLNKRLGKNDEVTSIDRVIEIPVKFDLNIEGLDKSIQILGANDTDIKTGTFSRFQSKKIESLFEEFEGSNLNLGLVVLGGGRSSGTNRDGVKFSDFNFSIILSPPGGMGLNVGLSAYTYQLKISPVLKAAYVKYQVEHSFGNNDRSSKTAEEVWDMNKVLRTELIEE